MATVYRARDKRLGREVAVKIIHRHLRENQEVAQRFQSEARAVAKLRHPNIVEVYDVSDAGEDERYLVVELVRGTTLRKLLAQHGAFPPAVAASVGIALASALDHAHGLGVIHRDLKPENVLVGGAQLRTTPDGDTSQIPVKLTDFGIAKLLDAQGVTLTGQVLGSPAHMAPEQIEGGEVSARSDVFGLGVLLYECMVGRLPFDGKNPAQVLRRVLDGAFTPPDRAEPRVGAAYAAILSKALSHAANDRYASTADLATALREELVSLGFDAPSQELTDFLADPDGYKNQHEERIVTKLTARAEALQKVRNVPLAAACFNRALAYRPQDARLLAAVSSLSRGARTRRLLERGALALLSAGIIGGSALAFVRRAPQQREPAEAGASGSAAATRPSAAAAVASVSAPVTSASTEGAPSAVPTRTAPVQRVLPRASAEVVDAGESESIARVQILVNGPQSATVRVDGKETPWFGKIQELSPGEHQFEFIAPDEECCEPGQTLRVKLRPATGPGDVQTVQGRIEFRPATLDVRGPAGSVVSCGALGEFPVPSQRQVPLRDGPRRVRCQFIPPPGSTEPPKEFDVTLRPGRLSTNLGQ